MRAIAVLFVFFWVSACSTSTSNERLPRYTFDLLDKGESKLAVYSVESEKYHLERMSGAGLSGLYLIKEIHLSSFAGGIEGNKGKVSLELMKINQNTGKTSNPIWFISESAQDWQFKDGYIVFIKRGCCAAPDQHIYYDISSGEKTKTLEKEPKRIIRTEPVYVFPG